MNILEVKNLNIGFNMYDKLLNQKLHQMVFDLNVTIKKGEILAIAGSSGSGKSLMAHAILGILPKNAVVSAEIKFKNEIVDENRLSQLRGKEITFVPQSIAYLDPLMTIEDQLMRKGINQQDFFKVMDTLGFTKADLSKYPFQLSGGMARRVLIANTILSKADNLVSFKVKDLMDKNLRTQNEYLILEKSSHVVTNDVEKELVAKKIIEFLKD